jgi:saccharopine dehydrogenase-like NADP-dependent oxidoreductase
MRKVAVVGAGKIGSTVVDLLIGSGAYEVLLVDQSAESLSSHEGKHRVTTCAMAIDDPSTLAARLIGCFAVVNCAPYHLTTTVARAAKAADAHYLDLTEDVASSRVVRDLAKDAKIAFIPQCGLAPGFITIAAWDLAKHFDELHDVRLRVGALPRYPSTASCARRRRWRSARNSPSTASPTRRSTPRAAWAPSATRSTAKSATSTTRPSAIRATPRS